MWIFCLLCCPTCLMCPIWHVVGRKWLTNDIRITKHVNMDVFILVILFCTSNLFITEILLTSRDTLCFFVALFRLDHTCMHTRARIHTETETHRNEGLRTNSPFGSHMVLPCLTKRCHLLATVRKAQALQWHNWGSFKLEYYKPTMHPWMKITITLITLIIIINKSQKKKQKQKLLPPHSSTPDPCPIPKGCGYSRFTIGIFCLFGMIDMAVEALEMVHSACSCSIVSG